MGKIRFLSDFEIQRIAAGEVIERPASIAKELLENALDAQATSITLSVEEGGKKSIVIRDNGSGIDQEDIPLALLPHATSKLIDMPTFEQGINTFGFRGEALSAIASISHITITTKTAQDLLGTELTAQFGTVSTIQSIAAPLGTRVQVTNIFGNSPVRKKFLKTKETEWHALFNTVTSIGFAAHTANIIIEHEGRVVATWQGTNSYEARAITMLDVPMHSHLIPLVHEEKNFYMEGVVSTPEYGTHDRSKIYIVVNKRPIRNPKLIRSIIKTYRGDVFSHRFPLVYLSITIPPIEVDINVHPRKEEVSFIHSGKIEHAIITGISNALAKQIKNVFVPKSFSFNESPDFAQTSFTKEKTTSQDKISDFFPALASMEDVMNDSPSCGKKPFVEKPFVEKAFIEKAFVNNASFTSALSEKTTEGNISPLRPSMIIDEKFVEKKHEAIDQQKNFVGIIANTYLVFLQKNELFLIDQHALHERIITEQLKKERKEQAQQVLITPLCLSYPEYELSLIEKNIDLFIALGITGECLPPHTFAIKSITPWFATKEITTIISLIIAQAKKKSPSSVLEQFIDECIGNIACHCAIRAGDVLSEKDISLLMRHAYEEENSAWCPHGRPTYQTITIDIIEKLFKRK